jgi:hypothetical protein
MTFRKFAAALLLVLSTAAAQAPLPTLRIEPTTGGSIFYIKNTYTKPVTAYLIELVDYPGSSFWLWADGSTDEMIPAGGELHKSISNMTVGAVPDYVKLQAAIFSDGSTAGIPEKIAQLVGRRRAILAAVRELIHRFENNPSPDAVKADLERWSASMPPAGRPNRSQAAIDQAATKMMISKTASRLGTDTPEKVITDLRALERGLAGSKPAL